MPRELKGSAGPTLNWWLWAIVQNKTVWASLFKKKIENPVNLFLENDLSVKELSQNTSLNESDRRSENRSPLCWVSSRGCGTDRDTCWPSSSQMFPSSCADYLYKTPFLQPKFHFLRIFDKMGLAREKAMAEEFSCAWEHGRVQS